MRIAVTGSTGRVGSAVVDRLRRAGGHEVLPWSRTDIDLDRSETAGEAIREARPDLVVHCAAWTDVDGCAREPAVARRRNGEATGAIARACADGGAGLLYVSTNEVFDGGRTDGAGYAPGDPPSPANPYGASKLAGEQAAAAAFEGAHAPLWIVRTSWVYGGPGADFPRKVVAAARRAAAAGEPLKLVSDEIGCPTWSRDLASGIVDLVTNPFESRIQHVVGGGHGSRADWARWLLSHVGLEVRSVDVSMLEWERPSRPPRWGVLAPTRLPTLGVLRPWREAVLEDLRERRDGLEGAA